MNRLLAVLSGAIVVACVKTRGVQLRPQQCPAISPSQVRIFGSQAELDNLHVPYSTVGLLHTASFHGNPEQIVASVREKAGEMGANGVLMAQGAGAETDMLIQYGGCAKPGSAVLLEFKITCPGYAYNNCPFRGDNTLEFPALLELNGKCPSNPYDACPYFKGVIKPSARSPVATSGDRLCIVDTSISEIVVLRELQDARGAYEHRIILDTTVVGGSWTVRVTNTATPHVTAIRDSKPPC